MRFATWEIRVCESFGEEGLPRPSTEREGIRLVCLYHHEWPLQVAIP